jgi:hypothetical protein
MAVTPVADDRDYPQMLAQTDHVEPAPRRVRATFGGEQILDHPGTVCLGMAVLPAVLHPGR